MKKRIITFLLISFLISTSLNIFADSQKIKQPSFVENGGMLRKNEHALLVYVDGTLIPPAIMFAYRYGIFFWWDIGFDIGGNYKVFQAYLHMKMENFKTKKSEFFIWSNRFKTGYKYHMIDITDTLIFDDKSWVFIIDNNFGFRLGKEKDKVIYLTTQFYIDMDLREPKRQSDYYLTPAILGFEAMLNKYLNFYIEAGITISLNGSETHAGLMYDNDIFPIGKIGISFHTGDKTAKSF